MCWHVNSTRVTWKCKHVTDTPESWEYCATPGVSPCRGFEETWPASYNNRKFKCPDCQAKGNRGSKKRDKDKDEDKDQGDQSYSYDQTIVAY